MRRALLTVVCVVWIALILACTGAGGTWFELPDGGTICRCDHRTFFLQGGSSGGVCGHLSEVGFDDRFILLRREECKTVRHKRWTGGWNLTFELTGKVEYYILEVSPPNRHGPFTEEQFDAAREHLGVPEELELEPTDKVRVRLERQQREQ